MTARLLLTLGMLVFLLGISLLMLRSWRRRLRSQSDLPPPPRPPQSLGDVVVAAVPGLFIGTTFAGDWLDRVAAHGLAHRDGIRFEREGEADLYLPFADVSAADVGDALAGKVIGKGGMLLVDWQLGGRLLTSGFRADDHRAHRRLADAISAHLPVREDSA